MYKPDRKKKRIFTRNDNVERRKGLRNHSTLYESTLWKVLKNRQIENLRFRRQHGIGSYIMDFYCPEIRLCIELDGDVHEDLAQNKAGIIRTAYLNEQGITVLRYDNEVVLHQIDAVIESIKSFNKEPKLIKGYIKNQYIR